MQETKIIAYCYKKSLSARFKYHNFLTKSQTKTIIMEQPNQTKRSDEKWVTCNLKDAFLFSPPTKALESQLLRFTLP